MTRAKKWNYEELLNDAERRGLLVVAQCDSQRRQLDRLVKRGELFAPHPRIYVRKEYWRGRKPPEKTLMLARALSTIHPEWVFCGSTAALLHGLEVPNDLLGCVQVAANRNRPDRAVNGVERVFTGGNRGRIEAIEGNRVVSAEEAALVCMADSSFPDGLAVADSLLRKKGMQRDDLLSMVCLYGRGPLLEGRLATIASHADGRSENGGESIARGVMIEQGFLAPDLQYELGDPLRPGSTFRGDYHWTIPDGQVIGELDGMDKYFNPLIARDDDLARRLAEEKRRESRLYMAGYRVMRFGMPEVRNQRALVDLLEGFGIPRHDAFGREVPKGKLLLGAERVVNL